MPSCRIIARRPPAPSEDPVLRTDPDFVSAYLEDAAHYPGGHAAGVASPASESQLAALLDRAPRVLAVGAQSSLTGGATPKGELVLKTSRLDRLHIDRSDRVTVGAGVTLTDLQAALRSRGLYYPPVPTYAGACAGGVVSTNAAGPSTFKYGTTRDWVEGLRVALASGEILELERGQTTAHAEGYFEIEESTRSYRVPVPTYRMPNVAKCSAGYFASAGMDLIDLFVGAEGTLGIVTQITFRIIPVVPASCVFFLTTTSDAQALELVATLRAASLETRASGDVSGIDISAIEHLDRRCLDVLVEDGADRRHGVTLPPGASLALLIQLDLPSATSNEEAYNEIGNAAQPDDRLSPLARTCRLFDRLGLLDQMEVALPEDRRRRENLFELREAVPAGINQRVARAKHGVDPRIEKVAADMIVPFDRVGDMMIRYRAGFERRGLDYAVWGHISDGNVHPNVIPRSMADVEAGRAAILEFGHEVVALGGSPLAEHGVGRNSVKQTLLAQLYGESGVAEMRKVKDALDPNHKLAPGVLF